MLAFCRRLLYQLVRQLIPGRRVVVLSAVGRVAVNKTVPLLQQPEAKQAHLAAGGRWWPLTCRARHRVAIIVPYRDRSDHLKIFLQHMHPFLQSQQLDYGIFIVEEVSNSTNDYYYYYYNIIMGSQTYFLNNAR